MNDKRTIICNLHETKKLAQELARAAKKGDCYCLIGDLGAGKTEFAREFIRTICGDVTVGSPTFNIVQEYNLVHHYDLYRLKDASELTEIGLEDSLNNAITLIEWPQIAEDLLPANRTIINLEIIDETTRKISICSN